MNKESKLFEDAIVRGSIRRLMVADSYGIEDGYVFAQSDTYSEKKYPSAEPEILYEFAKLAGKEGSDVLDFVKRWGLPIHSRIVTAQSHETRQQRDSVDLILKHAAQAKKILQIIDRRREAGFDDLENALNKVMIGKRGGREFVFEFITLDGNSRRVYQKFSYEDEGDHLTILKTPLADPPDGIQPDAVLPVIDMRNIPDDESAERRHPHGILADIIVQEVINRNVDGLVKLVMPEFGGLVKSYVFDSLLQVIYMQLVDAAGGARLYATCLNCGSYFKKTDGRQKYCPPIDTRESVCGKRYRRLHPERGREGKKSRTRNA